jgi:ABC-2 type transport system ATP-binding protein
VIFTGRMLLEVEGLTVRYGRRTALEGFSLSVDAGEVVGLLGPNGAGKSTALLAIAGSVLPAAGTVKIDGQILGTAAREVRARVGLCDQPPSLYEFHTAREHVGFVARARGASDDVQPLLTSLGLGPVADRLCRELSFGYRQRVGLAAALAGKTQIVLLDETLNGLDPHASRRAREVLTATAASGACVLMSTHLLAVAERLCTRLLVLDGGKLVADFRGEALETLLAAGPGALEEKYLALVAEPTDDRR